MYKVPLSLLEEINDNLSLVADLLDMSSKGGTLTKKEVNDALRKNVKLREILRDNYICPEQH